MRVPPFSSSILFELYERENEFYVQIFYRKTVSGDVPPLEIPNCGTMCPLEKFIELYQHILPTEEEDFNTLCQLEEKENNNLIIIILLNVVAILAIAMIVISIRRQKNSNPKEPQPKNTRNQSLSALPRHVLNENSVVPKNVVLPSK